MLLPIWLFIVGVVSDIAIVYPSNNENFTPNIDEIDIRFEFIDDNSSPHDTELDFISINLCTGPNNDITQVNAIAENLTLADFRISGTTLFETNLSISKDFSSDGLYFLQVLSFWEDYLSIHYSERFVLSNMTNSTKILHGSMEDPPTPDTKITQGVSTTDYANLYTIPYMSQTLSVKYASMQPQVGSFRTSRWSNTFNIRSISPYTTLGPSPNVMYTITEPPTYVINSGINTIQAQTPSHHHYDPNKRVQKPILRPPSVSHS
ncbi:putative cell wall synthesis protein Kre9p [[Candida] jaroonii]|uniref:Cell wall synthesis protein Kre9p n=1 Tax=[Candida] jaroonii TaxID=467808 RepID=A0ACA9YFJ8_9ASCO|nr:putative cell wall synthesis protein Kre9p [[Candida] jaroonii]